MALMAVKKQLTNKLLFWSVRAASPPHVIMQGNKKAEINVDINMMTRGYSRSSSSAE